LLFKLTYIFIYEGQRLAAQNGDADDILGAMRAQERAINDQEALSDEED
jgi:coiled-coil domain-containing protein 12